MGSTAGYRRRPRRGSLQFWPRVRAKRIYPKLRSWPKSKETKLLGFAGYKAGMTHILAVDNRAKAATKGEEIRIPVTILEAPSLRILGVRLFSKTYHGLKIIGEAWADNLTPELERTIKIPKKKTSAEKLKKLEELLPKASLVRVLAYTQPRIAGFGKKRPEIMEIALGGENIKAQFDYAKSILGSEVPASAVFKDGDMIDIHAVTKGKGYQGLIKRFGVKLERGKSSHGRRKTGTLGSWDAKTWRVPHSGQMGFHTRTEYNKQILKIGNIKEQDINCAGGIPHYGLVKNNYLLIAGSVAGPKKRLIRLTHAIRAKGLPALPTIVEVSRRSQLR